MEFHHSLFSEICVSKYVSFLAHQKLKHSPIKVYLSAIRHMQIASGLDDPIAAHWPRLEYVFKGIKHDQAEKGTKSTPRLPVTPLILLKLKAVWDRSAQDPDIKMLWAACCLAFFGFLR